MSKSLGCTLKSQEEKYMVVGPKEIIEKIKENEERIIKEIEKRIDGRLAEAKKETDAAIRKFTVDLGGLNVNKLIEQRIKEKYLLAGWKTVNFWTDRDRGELVRYVDLEA